MKNLNKAYLILILILINWGCQKNKKNKKLDYVFFINEYVRNIENNKYDSIYMKYP